MKTVFTFLVAFAIASVSLAQVNVTYQVDITDWLTAGNTLAATGMRVGGDFGTLGAENQGNAMADWSPSDAQSAMTDMGNNVWSITVTYPATAIGDTQSYKFVNGDWGTPGTDNEGGDSSKIATGGCGSDDGSGNINRQLEIPTADVGYQFCWEHCEKCDGSSPIITGTLELEKVTHFAAQPNPASHMATIDYTLAERTKNLSITIYNALGQAVKTLYQGAQSAGSYNVTWDLTSDQGMPVDNGVYFYTLNNGSNQLTQKLVIAR